MSKEDFIEAMGHVDDRILERYAQEEDRLNAKRPGKMWVRWTAAAACFAVIVGLLVLQKPDVPVYEDAIYSAQEIADLFGTTKNDGVATNAYTEVYVPSDQCLNLFSFPDREYLPIYQYSPSVSALNRTQFQDMIERILPKLSSALGEAAPEYEIIMDSSFLGDSLSTHIRFENYLFYLNQDASTYYFNLSKNKDSLECIRLDGEAIQIDQAQSNEEIVAALAGIKTILFDIFGVSFSDIKVNRNSGAIDIYYYDEKDHLLNAWDRFGRFDVFQWRPFSDYVCISFSNSKNNSDTAVSDSILTRASVKYHQWRTDVTQVYQETALAKMIPLEDAEVFLYNGFVFGGHSCRLCMATQDKVDFEGYDYVGLEYVFGRDDAIGEPTTGIPFYAFYKQIGTTENGNLIFAKTYVPAIEVSGYTEYFESQKEEHPS